MKAQIAAGASVVQLFDTWAGELSTEEYDAFELPATQMVLQELAAESAPKILFAKGSARHLESMAKSGADVLSVDWNTDLAEARKKLGTTCGAPRKRGPVHSARPSGRDSTRGASSDRKDGRRRAHTQSRARNSAEHAGRECASICPSGKSSVGGGSSMSDVRTKRNDNDRNRGVLRGLAREIQPARPALYQLSDRASLERRLWPERPRGIV